MDSTRVEKFINNGAKIENLNKVLTQMYVDEDKANWRKTQQDAYDTVFPLMRDMTDAEKLDYDKEHNGDGSETYPQVPIEYITTDKDGNEVRTPLDYVTFAEYIAETKVITPAVAEVVDSNGNVTTPAVPAVTTLVREFVPKASYKTEVDNYFANSDAWKARLKKEKQEALDKLQITADTIVYDANMKAITNMGSIASIANWNFNKQLAAGVSADDAYKAIYEDITINWRDANNNIQVVKVSAICEALETSMRSIANVIGVD